ncbi:hypothetical protein P9299_29895 [Bacillus cereus]|nr:hypothetical protein [Bacillus thuringiensis]MED4447214.1 hypothetical protein [Bacillus cereus]
MKYVWDLKRWKALRLESGIVFDDISEEPFNYTLDDEMDFQPLV